MICLDTAPLIWGVQGAARPDQVGQIELTKRFIRQLTEKRETIMVPTPALAEYLLGFPPEQIAEQQQVFEDAFFLPAFDVAAAVMSAHLAQKRDALRDARRAGVDRQALKIDIQIAAIAVLHGASMLITPDPHFADLVGSTIRVSNVPTVLEQLELLPAPRRSPRRRR